MPTHSEFHDKPWYIFGTIGRQSKSIDWFLYDGGALVVKVYLREVIRVSLKLIKQLRIIQDILQQHEKLMHFPSRHTTSSQLL